MERWCGGKTRPSSEVHIRVSRRMTFADRSQRLRHGGMDMKVAIEACDHGVPSPGLGKYLYKDGVSWRRMAER